MGACHCGSVKNPKKQTKYQENHSRDSHLDMKVQGQVNTINPGGSRQNGISSVKIASTRSLGNLAPQAECVSMSPDLKEVCIGGASNFEGDTSKCVFLNPECKEVSSTINHKLKSRYMLDHRNSEYYQGERLHNTVWH